ncbi:hypothetical protein [Thetidibacter halocola]|uniref:hypothetical protein n=1 Tax=Thetidibacter halocola TaxID=2827239 RepID=UPI001BA8AB05|nr:hypothetical protein [Thetidibacter halocola]
MKNGFRPTCKRRVTRRNAAGETPQEERRRKRAFDEWLRKQSLPSSRYFAMADYGSMSRPLTW